MESGNGFTKRANLRLGYAEGVCARLGKDPELCAVYAPFKAGKIDLCREDACELTGADDFRRNMGRVRPRTRPWGQMMRRSPIMRVRAQGRHWSDA